MIEILFAAVVSLGLLFTLAGAYALVRFPDFYTRVHGLSLAGSLGVACLLIGSLIYFNGIAHSFSIKEGLILLFLLFTGPVSTHMLSQAAYRTGVRLWEKSEADQLGKMEKERDPKA